MRARTTLVVAICTLVASLPASAGASAQWRDVRMSTDAERFVSAAGFDPETGRIFVAMIDPFRTSAQIAAYRPGRAEPVWERTFASSDSQVDDASSEPWALLVAPERHLVYVGGGYLSGMGSGPFTSSAYVYAFDTRTGHQVWSDTATVEPGMGGIYDDLAAGPGGSVIGVQRHLVGTEDNRSGSYATELVSFDAGGGARWRWIDSRVGLVSDVTTAAGAIVLVGETYVEGWARAYRAAVDSSTGELRWRDVTSDGTQHLGSVAASRDEKTLYLGGTDQHETGGQAMVRAVSAETGRARWTRTYGKPAGDPLTDNAVYDAVTRVVYTRTGPCVAGAHHEQLAHVYEPILPDDGFIACYAPNGTRLWIDPRAGGNGRVLVAAGGRLLWAGRQEASRGESSEEILRFAIRSLDDGAVRHESQKSYRTATYDDSDPLLALAHGGGIHFVTQLTHERNMDGSIKGSPWLLDRVFR